VPRRVTTNPRRDLDKPLTHYPYPDPYAQRASARAYVLFVAAVASTVAGFVLAIYLITR
jgi:hypothetical protein